MARVIYHIPMVIPDRWVYDEDFDPFDYLCAIGVGDASSWEVTMEIVDDQGIDINSVEMENNG
jgi:hypothetical protein